MISDDIKTAVVCDMQNRIISDRKVEVRIDNMDICLAWMFF